MNLIIMYNVLNISDPFLHFEKIKKGSIHLPVFTYHIVVSICYAQLYPSRCFSLCKENFLGKKNWFFWTRRHYYMLYCVSNTCQTCNEQEAHGPHPSPENQFNSMNKFEQSNDYIYHKIGPVVHENILKFSSLYFCNFAIISLWKRAWPFI